MEKPIYKITFTIGKSNDWLKLNLDDLAHCLNKNLRKTNQGEAVGGYKKGFFIIIVRGVSEQTIKTQYIDPFVKSMKKGKGGERFFVNLERIEEDHEEDFNTNSHVLFDCRDKYLTESIITGRSLKELAKGGHLI